ncbi:Neurofilament heavy polypeptide [Rhizoctonia solani]|uniref:Neurofilament heavy polypeptide n=1 Tax=Rhizoctonia solani TaxID=456999 RepID=A0A0K6G072_9AGAM|nr:Neurofilament heavy polypeptide [Rhizoctonia solani]
MQGGPSIISSRMFARDDRPVPNIVAIYERPRVKVRRDATHVLGGMFGWNTSEEMARAFHSEDSPAEESAASIPNSTSADASLPGPQQRCVKRSTKRSKRRSIVPLAEMGASILSISLQERMNRRQEGDEKEDDNIVSTLTKPSTPPLDITSATPSSTVTVKKIKVAAPADAPATKKLRLTISTAPPASNTSISTPLLQLPLSPPDTSSNASKAPTDERYPGPVTSSTPRTDQLPMPNFELDLSNFGGLSLSTLDSDSDSDSSSSESSSESSSDSPDLSSSTSTRSASQDKTKGKEKNVTEHALNDHSRNTTPSLAAPSTRNPSTPPPRRKRRTHQPGWVGWVQTEESPDHSRLIRLDDVPVILGRRTRSGKEFADPPPLRRKSTAVNETKEKQPAKSASNSNRMGQKPGRQSPLPEARKRGATEEQIESKVDGEHTPMTAEPTHGQKKRPSNAGVREPPAPVSADSIPEKISADSGDTISPPKRIRTSLGESTNAHQPVRGNASSVPKSATALPTPKPSVAPIPVLKLTRSDAIITPTGARSKEPERKEAASAKDAPSKAPGSDKAKRLGDLPMRPLPTSDSPRKDVAQANVEKTARPGLKGTAQSQSKDTTSGVSRPALGTSKSSTLINNIKSAPTGSSSSPDSNVKRPAISAIGSSSKGLPIPVGIGKARTALRIAAEKAQAIKSEPTWNNTTQTANSGSPEKLTPNANSSISLKASSSASKITRPFPMTLPSRTEKSEPEPKPSPLIKLSTLGKRKDSSSPLPSGQSSSSSQSRAKKRKLALSSSDESEGPRFIVNPFDRRAKKLELTRKGVSGEAFQAEMKKWMHAKKAEWREKERQKEKQNDKPGGNEIRTAIAEGKPVSESVRHRLAGGSTSTRIGEAKLARKKVYNSDWGMDVAKVSVAGSSEKRPQARPEWETEKREVNVKDAREPNAGKIKRESDTSKDLTKPKRVLL